MNIRDPTGKLARWSIYLQQYDYTISTEKAENTLMLTHLVVQF